MTTLQVVVYLTGRERESEEPNENELERINEQTNRGILCETFL